MKSIIFFRHGNAEISIHKGTDFERTLSTKGINDVIKMGLHVSFIKEIPDVVISSTAVRALLTAKFAIKHGEWKCPLLFEPSIYGGSPSFLMKLINNQSNNLSSICLVGHEPNFSNFISQATGSNFIKFSTASLAKIDFDINIWKHITFGLGKLKWFVSPENLK